MTYRERAEKVVKAVKTARGEVDAEIAQGINKIWWKLCQGLEKDRIKLGNGYIKVRLNNDCNMVEIYYPATTFWRKLFGFGCYNKVIATVYCERENCIYGIQWSPNDRAIYRYMHYPLKSLGKTGYLKQEPQDDFDGVVRAIETTLSETIIAEYLQEDTTCC